MHKYMPEVNRNPQIQIPKFLSDYILGQKNISGHRDGKFF